jgi:hypothetical protein
VNKIRKGTQKSFSGAVFGRSDVARLLNIPEWLLANFASHRYPYGLLPSVRGAQGRGKKGRYTLRDIYKIAVAYRLHLTGFSARIVASAVSELFSEVIAPTPNQSSVTAQDARSLVIDFSLAPWVLDEGKLPEEWGGGNPKQWNWVRLEAPGDPYTFSTDKLRATFEMPFDALLNWVDSQILGRKAY